MGAAVFIFLLWRLFRSSLSTSNWTASFSGQSNRSGAGAPGETIFALNAFKFILYYTRGSGLDILLAYSLFSGFTSLLFPVVLNMLDLDLVGRGTAQRGARLSVDPTI